MRPDARCSGPTRCAHVAQHTAGAPEESFGCHVQQAAEKVLKAWLALLGEVYPLPHNLELLLDLLAERRARVEAFRDLVLCTPFAVEFRYGGVRAGTEPIHREVALALVEHLAECVRRRVVEAGET